MKIRNEKKINIKKFDPLTLAVLSKRFEAVTSKMANTLL